MTELENHHLCHVPFSRVSFLLTVYIFVVIKIKINIILLLYCGILFVAVPSCANCSALPSVNTRFVVLVYTYIVGGSLLDKVAVNKKKSL